MITVTFSGETSADVHAQIKAFADSPNTVSTEPTKGKNLKKVEDAADADEEKPAKAKKAKDEVVLDDATLRQKIKENEWPIEKAKAFVKKFGYDSIPDIPAKKRQEFIDQLEKASSWSNKQLDKFLEDEEL